METDVTFALIGPILGPPLLLGYSVPLFTMAIAGPRVLQRRGARALGLLFASLVVGASATVSVVGGWHRGAMGTGGFSVFGAGAAAIALAMLLTVPTVVIALLDARARAPRVQALAALGVSAIALILASPILFLGVSCVVSGECV